MNPKIQTAPADQAALEKRFEELVAQWLENVQWLSNQSERVADPIYQQIIAMGWPAVPLLIRQIDRDLENGGPSDWFQALRSITGEDPTNRPERPNGAIFKAKLWLEWAKKRGIQRESV
jgi:hypothetical protein